MKIGEAQRIYSVQYRKLWNQKREYLKQEKESAQKAESGFENDKKQGSVLTWTKEQQRQLEETEQFMQNLAELRTGLYNAAVAKQQGEAVSNGAEDMAKCMEIARRISAGSKVPASDEKRLMEYSFELYLTAKNAATLNRHKSKKEYDSLWGDEEENPNGTEDLEQDINDRELSIKAPEQIEV